MRIAYDPITERELFLLAVPSPARLPSHVRLATSRFVCLVVWDAAAAADDAVRQVAKWLVNMGAVYVCCWGSDCERVHDAVDTEDISRNPSCDRVIMTTWHDKVPLDEAIYFALNTAWPDEGYAEGCGSTLAVCIGNETWAASVRSAFSDPRGFSNRLCS
jgi:hypothetical protein